MKDEHKIISVRVPAELLEQIDRLASAEAQRTGLPVDRSGIIRRALVEELKRRGEVAA